MSSIIRIGAARAGTKAHLSEQSFQSSINNLVIHWFACQYRFGLTRAPRSRSARTNIDANLSDDIFLALKPYCDVHDRQGYTLWAHDTSEARSLSLFIHMQIKTNQ